MAINYLNLTSDQARIMADTQREAQGAIEEVIEEKDGEIAELLDLLRWSENRRFFAKTEQDWTPEDIASDKRIKKLIE